MHLLGLVSSAAYTLLSNHSPPPLKDPTRKPRSVYPHTATKIQTGYVVDGSG